MGYGDIPDLIFTTDADGNVNYGSSNSGGYTTGGGTGGGTTGTSPATTTGKKWWETAIGILPALFSSIFGTSQAQTPYPYGYPAQTGSSNGGIFGTSSIVIIAVAVLLVIFLLKKK